MSICMASLALVSPVLVYGAVEAANDGYNVLVVCPTGTLVHSYRDRLPQCNGIVVETVHSGFAIYRGADRDACQYSPPTRLRRYDLIFIDEILFILSGKLTLYGLRFPSSLMLHFGHCP